ncbi:LuxR C-terminal-related transcriptional regulator [Nocardia sp. NPDC058633]|uniref:LuxR C-terminal-related transcriptional regulator n=1 Tax=Nocardia sp. NPDC058633 TaxID=3346568 RepID=UPI003662DD63
MLFVARRIRSARIAIVLTESALRSLDYQRYRSDLLKLSWCAEIRLAPLTVEGVAKLVCLCCGGGCGHGAEYHGITGGNRLLLQAVVAQRRQMGATGQVPLPDHFVRSDAFRQAVLDCLLRHEPAAIEIAGGLAVLGECSTPALLGDLLDLSADIVASVLQGLEHSGLLVAGRFRHEAIESAVLDIRSADLIRLHRGAARLLYLQSAPASLVAEHLLGAGDLDEPWMVDMLCSAAKELEQTDDAALGSQYLELASASCVDDRRRADIDTELAGLDWQLETFNLARNIKQVAHAGEEIASGSEHTAVLVRYLLRYGRFAEVSAALDAVGALGETGHSPVDLGSTKLLLASSYPPLFAQLAPAGPGRQAPLTSRRAEPFRYAATVLADVLSGRPDGAAITTATAALGMVRLSHKAFEQVECTLLALIYTDDLDRADTVGETLLGIAERLGSAAWIARLSALHAEIAIRRGRLAIALERGDAALARLTPQAWGVVIGMPLSSLIMAATAMGELSRAAEYLAVPVPEDIYRTRFGLHYLYAYGEYHLATNDLQAALGDFALCGSLMGEWGIDVPGFLPWRTGAARVFLRLGKQDRAVRLIDEQIARLDRGQARASGITLQMKAATRDPEGRVALLRQAVDELQECGDQLELARALADLGTAYQALGERQRARTILRRAAHLAEVREIEPLRRQLALEASDIGVDGDAESFEAEGTLTVLSEAERRVVVLAATGYTNREIAGKLYLTISTVEQHLTRIYRKLNVAGRSDLPLDFSASIPAPSSSN